MSSIRVLHYVDGVEDGALVSQTQSVRELEGCLQSEAFGPWFEDGPACVLQQWESQASFDAYWTVALEADENALLQSDSTGTGTGTGTGTEFYATAASAWPRECSTRSAPTRRRTASCGRTPTRSAS